MKRVIASIAVAIGAHFALVPATSSAQQFPSRPIEISPWGAAGGGLDFAVRLIAKVMEKELGQSIVVVNRTGGGGGVAMNYVWSKPHDGYFWLGASDGMQNAAVMGFHNTTTKDWRWYMIGGAPTALAVRSDSPFKTYADFVKAAQAAPGKVNVSHCAIGCVFHLKTIALGIGTNTKLNMVPYPGSAPAMVASLSGDSDAVVAAISEEAEYIKGGRLRALGMIETAPFKFDAQTIPAIGATYPDIMAIPTRQWLGFAVPADTPKSVTDRIDAAFVKAMKDDELQKVAKERFIDLWGYYGDESMKTLLKMESAVSWKLFELGVAKISPDTLGIAKP